MEKKLAHLMQFLTAVAILTTEIENGACHHCLLESRVSRFLP